MKHKIILTHKIIALLLAVCAMLVTTTTSGCLYLLGDAMNSVVKILIGTVVVLVSMYVIAFYLTKSFIIEKVRPVYKIIRSAQMPKYKELIGKDVNLIETAMKDAAEWTEKKGNEIELLKKQEEFRKEYVGNVAHELRTPIFALQGYISTLLDGGLYDETINEKYLIRSDKVIQRMTSIVQDLDAISRLESGKLKMEYTTFNIVDVVKEIFESQEYLAKKQNVTLNVETTLPKQFMLVYADKMTITTAISNLVVNAIKYNKPEGGSVRIRFYDMDTRFLVEVSDTGIGIPQEYLSRIFERFFRVDKSRSREQGGTGLGLAIVKHVVEAHNESINVKSTLNVGTSFSFTIKKPSYDKNNSL